MPIFQYKGYKADGALASGTIEADGLHDAVLKIRESGIYPKDISEYSHKRKKFALSRTDTSLLPNITRQLSMLISSGVPLIEALRSLSEENRGFWRELIVKIKENVSAGASLSRAMEGYKDVFPEFYINMVAAGEQSGTLDRIMARLADFIEQQNALKAKIRMSMIYPVFMICISIIVLSFLFSFVIPKIVKIFENTKSTLPFITVILIQISNLFINYWWAMIGMLASLVFVARQMQTRHKQFLDSIKLKLPGNIIQTLYFARFTRILGFLLEGGIPMLRAMEFSARSIGNIVLMNRITEAAKKVAEGARLSAALEGFSPVLLQLISTGEKGGNLAEVLNKAASSYEEEFNRRVQKALSLLEPSMIILMGLVVGFIVFAVLLPMFQLNQIVK